MRIRPKTLATDADITLDDDETVVGFATTTAALVDVWSAMVWLQSTSPTLTTVRREIAKWARDTDASIAEMFGRSVGSEEIRVLLEQLPGLVPRRVDAADRVWLEAATDEAQRLTAEGRAAIIHVTG